ncbi:MULTISPECIES: hypothetical protein [Mucilaginibacter]|jgi:hypothetical protein|uniref:hypothetical protein n=1 Tax=Mucilaginibacter TaxID=423349 RepID=UPI00087125AF|nr:MULTISPECIES: hypothetical protein [Mucilaginibacter]NVM63734.1 hypothetical protein [Mucilaginibacter sp. SG538B]GGB25769.1 hypothetical protein GCM10011500_47530 [Mucilaginibacter rubeus]SCW68814.1 hypothetical protein SAMN03159284_03025 [Mucilaginibacter sp. NFR10]
MLNKISNSLAYRLPVLYRSLLKYKPLVVGQPKASSAYTVLMMTGKSIIDMTRLAVYSIAKYWEEIPKLIIASDGSLSPEEIKSKFKFWPGELIVKHWQQSAVYHQGKNRINLLNYAESHVLGKKLAVILHQAEIQPVIWIDSDILFYKDFKKYIPQHNGFVCGGSQEGHSTYDDRVLNFYGNNLYDTYTFSSGLLIIYGPRICEDFRLEELLFHVSNYVHYFTEQTIFAHIASSSIGIPWTTKIIKNDHQDSQQIKPMKKKGIVGRHYTANVRHLFWRDSLFNL